jgi:hypothetical protein
MVGFPPPRQIAVARPPLAYAALPLPPQGAGTLGAPARVGLWPCFAPRQRRPAGAPGVSKLPRQVGLVKRGLLAAILLAAQGLAAIVLERIEGFAVAAAGGQDLDLEGMSRLHARQLFAQAMFAFGFGLALETGDLQGGAGDRLGGVAQLALQGVLLAAALAASLIKAAAGGADAGGGQGHLHLLLALEALAQAQQALQRAGKLACHGCNREA